MDALYRVLRFKAALIISCILLALFSIRVQAQVTPNELSRLSLEELLDIDIGEIEGEEKWFLSYDFSYLEVGRYQKGTERLSFDDVLFSPGKTRTTENFPIVPTFIEQKVHAFSLGREISPHVSLGITVPFVQQETMHISSVPNFDEFILKSSGIGDFSVFSQYKFLDALGSSGKFGIGVSFPTGSINAVGDTPRAGSGTLERLPYTMQIGSGTYDILAALSYEKIVGHWAYGANASATIRTGRNANNYRLGNNIGLDISAQYKAWKRVQPTLFASIRKTKQIVGRDESLANISAPFPFGASITDPGNFGGTKVKIGTKVKFCISKDCGFSIALKGSLPLYQNLNGIQLREKFNLSSAVNFSF